MRNARREGGKWDGGKIEKVGRKRVKNVMNILSAIGNTWKKESKKRCM